MYTLPCLYCHQRCLVVEDRVLVWEDLTKSVSVKAVIHQYRFGYTPGVVRRIGNSRQFQCLTTWHRMTGRWRQNIASLIGVSSPGHRRLSSGARLVLFKLQL